MDKANGYVFGSGEERNIQRMLSCAVGAEFDHDKFGGARDLGGANDGSDEDEEVLKLLASQNVNRDSLWKIYGCGESPAWSQRLYYRCMDWQKIHGNVFHGQMSWQMPFVYKPIALQLYDVWCVSTNNRTVFANHDAA